MPRDRDDDYDDDYEDFRPTSRRRTGDGSSGLADFLAFRKMLVPMIIQIIFWLMVIGCVISGIMMATKENAAIGILLIIFGPIYVRIVCEIMIVMFRILDVLTEIRNSLSKR